MSTKPDHGITQEHPIPKVIVRPAPSPETPDRELLSGAESQQKARRVYDLLLGEYGTPLWWQHHDPMSQLIATVLSQNTSDINSGRAFQRLVESFRDWEAVRQANEDDIALAIKSAGLSNIKARRIKTILQNIVERNGQLSLDFLQDLEVGEAKSWLQSLDGVGPKTAACVLLFSLGMPAFPVDTHVFRVTRRVGLVDTKMSVEAAHDYLEVMVKPDELYAFHMNLIAHGRRTCKAQRPKCDVCVLHSVCDNPVHGNTVEDDPGEADPSDVVRDQNAT